MISIVQNNHPAREPGRMERATYRSSQSRRYKKTNGLSRRPSCLQVTGIFLFLGILAMQATLIESIFAINHPILMAMGLFFYLLMLAIAVEYCRLMISDPVDPRLLDSRYQQRDRDLDLLVFCQKCKVNVHKYSYHCNTCKRCVEEFDHHCKYVNNCVGKQNYVHFYRLLLFMIMFLLDAAGEGVWVALRETNQYRWAGAALAALSALLVMPHFYLAFFHCYISFFKYGTTLKYLRGEHEEGTTTKDGVESTATDKIKEDNEVQIVKFQCMERDDPMGTQSALKKQCLY